MIPIAIVGPTGIGKSEVALELAKRLSGEIVSIDSMQIYRGMDIGTGKPEGELRRQVPHHGLDLVEPEESYNAVRFAQEVRPQIDSIVRRGNLPILVGGSGLYLRALVEGIAPAPAGDPEVRRQLLDRSQEEGTPALVARLMSVDPSSAARIHPNDLRRIIRALEVYEVTGEPLSQWQLKKPFGFASFPCTIFGLTCLREQLYSRIEARIERWLKQGWLAEARVLAARKLSPTAKEALGYKELFAHLQGRVDWETTVSLIQRNTRRYAKRQWAWFKVQTPVRWLSLDGDSSSQVAERIFNAGLTS